MNEEEKKAIEWLKNATFFSARIYAPSILNLIEKQQKEIESLKKGNKSLMDSRKKWKDRYYKQRYIDYKQEKEIEELKERNISLTEAIEEWVNGERINDIKHISKDKINEKIREIISKYVDIEEQLTYESNELFGEELTNMIKELLEE